MEAYLIENESVLGLDEDTFSAVEIVEAELSLKDGRKSKESDGRIDILATYSQEYIAIVELKLGQLEKLHLDQMEDYLRERGQIAQKYPNILSAELEPNHKWIGVLVGTTISSALAEELRSGYLFEGIPIAALTVQRFRGSDGSILVTTDTYFSHQQSAKDTTKYRFDGEILGKGRLVLSVVKRHVDAHPNITFPELEKAFPKTCQGARGVLSTAEQANEVVASSGRKRHFLNPEDLIHLDDGPVVAVSNQWGVRNIGRFIRHTTKKLGYKIDAADG
jgi:hypothetical protein